MEYRDLRTLFHISEKEAAQAYDERVQSKDSLSIDLYVSGHRAFFLMDSEIYRLILRAERLSHQIDWLINTLPRKAIDQYMMNCLIDEIVLTNDIEGVNSTRREISEVLERLERNDRKGRFRGIVEKYLALRSHEEVALGSCADVRRIYDDLVLDEVAAQNGKNVPDGRYFRLGPVSVLDAAQRLIHHGFEPEEKIIEAIESGLALLNNKDMEALARVALFHFIFAYAHPFYDGNGRTNRFISSYVLAKEFHPLVGYRLSFSIKEQIAKYYKAFSMCEHPLNRGDLTPFVILFSEIVIDAMESMKDSLLEKKKALLDAEEKMHLIPGLKDGKEALVRDRLSIASLLIQAALFAEHGIPPKEIAQMSRVSMPTAYIRLKFFEEKGLVVKRHLGHSVFYKMDLNVLNELVSQ